MRSAGAASAEDSAAGPAPGLRERSKARRRVAIQRTAMRLFAERGYEHTTLADIADEAEVSVRTITGYFGSKADLAMSYADDTAARLTATFAARPGADPLDSIDAWLTMEEELLEPDTAALSAAMFEANPDLRALSSSHLADAAELGRTALAEHLGVPPGHPMADITGAAVGSALGAYLTALWQHGPSPDLHRAFMKYLRASVNAARPD